MGTHRTLHSAILWTTENYLEALSQGNLSPPLYENLNHYDNGLPEQYTIRYLSLYKLIFNELARLYAPLFPKMDEPPAFVF